MPKYDYRCEACSSKIEFEKKINEDTFPECCNQPMQRVWNPTSVIFNGKGFFSTDNRK